MRIKRVDQLFLIFCLKNENFKTKIFIFGLLAVIEWSISRVVKWCGMEDIAEIAETAQ